MAINEEDQIARGIEVIQKERGLIQRAFLEAGMLRKQQADNIRGESLEKVLFQLEKTFKRGIERIGQKIQLLPLTELQNNGLEAYQGHLEILFSLLNLQQSGGET